MSETPEKVFVLCVCFASGVFSSVAKHYFPGRWLWLILATQSFVTSFVCFRADYFVAAATFLVGAVYFAIDGVIRSIDWENRA